MAGDSADDDDETGTVTSPDVNRPSDGTAADAADTEKAEAEFEPEAEPEPEPEAEPEAEADSEAVVEADSEAWNEASAAEGTFMAWYCLESSSSTGDGGRGMSNLWPVRLNWKGCPPMARTSWWNSTQLSSGLSPTQKACVTRLKSCSWAERGSNGNQACRGSTLVIMMMVERKFRTPSLALPACASNIQLPSWVISVKLDSVTLPSTRGSKSPIRVASCPLAGHHETSHKVNDRANSAFTHLYVLNLLRSAGVTWNIAPGWSAPLELCMANMARAVNRFLTRSQSQLWFVVCLHQHSASQSAHIPQARRSDDYDELRSAGALSVHVWKLGTAQ